MVPFKILAHERMRHSFYSRLSLTAPRLSSRVRIWRQRIISQKVQILMSAEWDNNYSSIVMSWLRSRRDSTNMNIRLSGQYLLKHIISPHNTAMFFGSDAPLFFVLDSVISLSVLGFCHVYLWTVLSQLQLFHSVYLAFHSILFSLNLLAIAKHWRSTTCLVPEYWTCYCIHTWFNFVSPNDMSIKHRLISLDIFIFSLYIAAFRKIKSSCRGSMKECPRKGWVFW